MKYQAKTEDHSYIKTIEAIDNHKMYTSALKSLIRKKLQDPTLGLRDKYILLLYSGDILEPGLFENCISPQMKDINFSKYMYKNSNFAPGKSMSISDFLEWCVKHELIDRFSTDPIGIISYYCHIGVNKLIF